jgi:hypothetical protein
MSFKPNGIKCRYSNRGGNVKANHFRSRLFKEIGMLRGADFFAERTECASPKQKIRKITVVPADQWFLHLIMFRRMRGGY